MLVKERFLNKIYTTKDNIIFERAALLNSLYRKENFKFKKDFLPNGWHWIFFNENNTSEELDFDGHLKRGKVIPRLFGYKRMYAGGELIFKKKIRYGHALAKKSFIQSITRKSKNGKNLYFINKKIFSELKMKYI